MELTKEHFDKVVEGLASKKDLHHFATAEELQKVSATVDDIVRILDRQTTVLDGIAKDVKDWNTEMVMVRARLDRHDQWFKQMAEHINIKLQN